MTKKDILNAKTVAYYTGLNGIEIKAIEYGIDDYILCVDGAYCSKKTAHRVKVYETVNGDFYFIISGRRIPLNECIRCNAF